MYIPAMKRCRILQCQNRQVEVAGMYDALSATLRVHFRNENDVPLLSQKECTNYAKNESQ
jgi:hypothetical protein